MSAARPTYRHLSGRPIMRSRERKIICSPVQAARLAGVRPNKDRLVFLLWEAKKEDGTRKVAY